MDIDFNNLRKQIAYSLDRVIKILNEGILPEKEFASHRQENGNFKNWEGDVLIDKEELQRHIDGLRQDVWVLQCCYEEGNSEYQSTYEEVQKFGGYSSF